MKREQKEVLIEELSKQISDYSSIIMTDFTGISVQDITTLRRSLSQNAATLKVVKNTLLKRAANDTSLEPFVKELEGPTALVLCNDAVSGAKVIIDFAKKEKKPGIKKAFIEGSIIGADEVQKLASLPPKPVLLSMLMSGINSPLVQTMNIMRGVVTKFVLTLEALKATRETGN